MLIAGAIHAACEESMTSPPAQIPEQGADGDLDQEAATALLVALRGGDAGAARALVERLTPVVARIAQAYCPSRESIEDLCQAVFMEVFADLDSYRGDAPLRHWVTRVAVHTCLDRLRRERRRPELRWADLTAALAAWIGEGAAAPSSRSIPDAIAARDLVERLLATLPPRDRLLVHWLELEELSVAEVARRTGWNATLVRVRAFHARARLRKAIERLERKP